MMNLLEKLFKLLKKERYFIHTILILCFFIRLTYVESNGKFLLCEFLITLYLIFTAEGKELILKKLEEDDD